MNQLSYAVFYNKKKAHLHLSGVIEDDNLQGVSVTFVPIKTQTNL